MFEQAEMQSVNMVWLTERGNIDIYTYLHVWLVMEAAVYNLIL